MPRIEEEELTRLSRTLAQCVRNRDVAGAVAVAESNIFAPVGHHRGVARRYERALSMIPPGSPADEARLRSRYGVALGMEEVNYDGALEAFDQARVIAQRLGDAALEMQTLAWGARVDRFHLRFQECLDKTEQVIELSQRTNTNAPIAEGIAHRWAARVLEIRGNLKEARQHAEAALALAETSGDSARLTSALDISANLYRLEGNWQEARDINDRGLAVEPRSPQLLGGRALLEYELCRNDDGRAVLEDLLEAMDLIPPGASAEYSVPAGVIPVVARMTGGAARLDIAERSARTVLQSSPTPAAEMWARAGLAVLAVLQSDMAASGEHYTSLVRQEGTMLSTGVSMAADRLLGLLALTMRNLDQAMTHLEAALGFCRRAGYRPELAWTCCDYADALLQRKGDEDRDRAVALLDESLAISRELGMCHLAGRVQSVRERNRL